MNQLNVFAGGDPTLTVTGAGTGLDYHVGKFASLYPNLRTIRTLVLDDSLFTPSDPFPTSWEWEDLVSSDGALPTSTIINQNAVHTLVKPTQPGQAPQVRSLCSLLRPLLCAWVPDPNLLRAGHF